MVIRRLLTALIGVALVTAVAAGEAVLEVPARHSTSAGVFDAAGNLVRTLWRGQRHAGGELRVYWDGKDDDGLPAASGPYSVRVLAHDVHYEWEGVIGNTSHEAVGASVHRAFNPINDMAIDAAGNAFYVVGYLEQQQAIHRFNVENPQVRASLAHSDYRRVFQHAATDGELLYLANAGLIARKGAFNREPETFVVALRVADGQQHEFAHGRTVYFQKPQWARWESVIDYDRDDQDDGKNYRSAPGGIAVQKTGDVLFVSHPGVGEIRLWDKRDGASLGRLSVADATDLHIAPDDSLWVLRRARTGAVVARYRLRDGVWRNTGEVAAGLVDPVAIGVSPVDGTLLVVDAGSEQLKAFDDSGAPRWTLGRPQGYRAGGPEVRDDRFWFSGGPSYVAFQPDGSFWVGDPGNFRNLHFDAERRYIEQIAFVPASYTAAVDLAEPSRVFNRFLEYRVDYAQPIAASWTLVRNWAVGLAETYRGFAGGIRMVTTLQNGRTYAVVVRRDPPGKELVELTADGLRLTGIALESGTRLYPTGSLRWHTRQTAELTVWERRLTGFDRRGNPTWGGSERIGRARAVDDVDPHYHQVATVVIANEATFPETSNGVIVSFNPGVARGFHLGGIVRGASQWRWRASPTATWQVDAAGVIVDPDGSFDVRPGVHYPASIVTAAGSNIVFGYHGEGWNQGQASQWIHYQDDGLFVGQFGTPVYPWRDSGGAPAGSAGNAFSPTLVEVDGRLYLYHNDEGIHAGVHRWRIDGLESLVRVSAPIAP